MILFFIYKDYILYISNKKNVLHLPNYKIKKQFLLSVGKIKSRSIYQRKHQSNIIIILFSLYQRKPLSYILEAGDN